jgi:hypothetical protein
MFSSVRSLIPQLLSIALFCICLPETAAQQTPGHYYLVVDHSGSMLSRIRTGSDSGKTRWEVMRQRASAFVGRMPDGSSVWTGIFSARNPIIPLDSEDTNKGWLSLYSSKLESVTQRDRLTSSISTFAEPALSNGTWLYQATHEALKQLEIESERDPDGFYTVLIYTDGEDQGHGRTTAEMIKNPKSLVTRIELEKEIANLKKKLRNFNIVNVYRPQDESIRDAHVIRLLTNRLHLANPIVASRQEVEIGFQFRDDENLSLEGRPITLEWVASEAEGISVPPLRIQGGPFLLKNGIVKLNIDKMGEWPSGKDVRARIKVNYPQMDQTFLVPEGGEVIDLFFQAAEKPVIRDLLPANDSVFPIGRSINFSLTTLAKCEVEWDFGDGSSAKGNPASHVFERPGKSLVRVKVTDASTGLTESASITLNLNELKITLDPVLAELLPNKEIKFSATSVGDFRSYDWLVGGKVYGGKVRSDGARGTYLITKFDRPGPVEISVKGDGVAGGSVITAPTTILVKEVPAIRLTSPVPGDSLYFGSKRECRVEIEGVEANQVRFTLKSNGKELIPSRAVDVRREGQLRIATLPMMIPNLSEKIVADLQVETLGVEPSLQREIQVNLESEPAFIEIALPDGREPHIFRETPLRLESNAPIKSVRWNFGEGWIDGGEIQRHTWNRYGSHQIQATAKGPDGTDLIAATVEINIPVRPVTVDAKAIYKERVVGSQVAKVPVNATLELRSLIKGDVIGSRWLLDGVVMPEGQQTLVVKERGFKSLTFIADGTPESGGIEAAVATIEFRTSDKILFWAILAGIVFLMVVASRILLGNKWRFAQLHVGKKQGGSLSDGGNLTIPWRIRSWWTKRSEISMLHMDERTCPGWQGETRVRFEGGKDPKLLPFGPEWQESKIEAQGSKKLNRGYLKQWTFPRKPLMRLKRDLEHREGTINLTIPALKPGVIGRWPEFLFVCIVFSSVAATRMLYLWLY